MSGDRSFHLIEAVAARVEGALTVPRRRWSEDFKERAVAAALVPGVNVSAVAREMGVSPSQLFGWRRQAIAKGAVTPEVMPDALTASLSRSSPSVEIAIGTTVIRVSADIGEGALRRVIRAVCSA